MLVYIRKRFLEGEINRTFFCCSFVCTLFLILNSAFLASGWRVNVVGKRFGKLNYLLTAIR